MPEQPTTCVIGAGVSGLTAVKALGDWRIPHTCFEASDDVGGNWYFQNPNGRSSAYRSLHIDTSKNAISFSDFPMDGRYPDFPHHSEIKQFLQEYAERFGAARADPLQHRGRARRAPARRRVADPRPPTARSTASTRCWCATGTTGTRRTPTSPASSAGPRSTRTSTSIPSDPLDLAGKRVLVVGIGNSAVDITSELARKGVAEKVFISTRSGAWVVPKYVFGRPADQVFKTNPRLPLGLQRRIAPDVAAAGLGPDGGLRPARRPTTTSSRRIRRSRASCSCGSAPATRSRSRTSRRSQGDSVRFTDGSVERVDAIVYATGYQISFPFFDPGFISAPGNVLPLYKRMFKPGIDDLGFIGFGQAIPTIFPFAECQSKLAGRWLAGDWAPPGAVEMEQEIRRDERRFIGHYNERPRHTMQLDYYVYDYDLRQRVIPAGQERARTRPPRPIAGRAALAHAQA